MEIGVLFCDQVGSTDLLTRLGDALADEIRRDLFEALYRAAELCRGEVVKSSGDGLMVVFPTGADDALDCGYLMVAMVIRLARRQLWSGVQFKVGVSHGDAVSDEGDWYGASVNLAARLCAAAAPSQVLAAAATVDASRHERWQWVTLPAMALKGFPEAIPVRARQVDPAEVPDRAVPVELDLLGARPLEGRQGTLDHLGVAWDAARNGQSNVVSVVGAPGMGVSRVLAELAESVTQAGPGEPALVLSARGDTGAGWAVQLIRSHAAAVDLDDLRSAAGADAAALVAICPLVGLRLSMAPKSDPTSSTDELVTRFLARVATKTPTLLLLDGVDTVDTDTDTNTDTDTDTDTEAWLSRVLPSHHCLAVTGARVDRATLTSPSTIALGELSPPNISQLLAPILPAGAGWSAEVTDLTLLETNGVPRDVIAVIDELVRAESGATLTRQVALDAVRRTVPYKGLQVFSGDDAVRFYGRARAVDDVLDALAQGSFVVVVGSSGSGKSSVVRAGCLPRLAGQDVDVVVFAPGEDPLRALAGAWCRAFGGDPNQLVEQLHLDPSGLVRAAADLYRPVVVVVDQLEECFTLCADEGERELFFHAVTEPIVGLSVLATLRGDFYGRASEHAALADALQDGTVVMTPPTSDELRTVIEAPAASAHLRLEPGLSDLILSDITDRPGGLPLLSHALSATWLLRHGGTLAIADYRAAGGATGAIARTADTVFDQLSTSEQEIAKRIFLRLTALGEGVEDSRRRVPLDVLLASGSDGSTKVLGTLTAARLVTAGTDADGTDIDELAHEALLREWPRLRDWLDEDRDELRALAHLETAARDWDAAGRGESELYAGRRLDAAETISADKLNILERAYLGASLEHREAQGRKARRATRRLQSLVVVLVIFLVAALVAGVVAVRQRTDAHQQTVLARAGELTSQAAAVQRTQPSLALLLALEAQKLHDSPQTRAGLLTVLSASPHMARIEQSFGKSLSDFGLSPNGRTAAVGYGDGSFRLWDFASERPLTPRIRVGSNTVGIIWVTSRVIATLGTGGVRLWNGRTGAALPVRFLKVPKLEEDYFVGFSPGGHYLGIEKNGTITLWLGSGGEPVRSFPTGESSGRFSAFRFNPAGTQIATIGDTADGRAGVVHLIDPLTGKDARSPLTVPEPMGDGLDYSPDGRTLAVATSVGVVTRFDVSTGQTVGTTLTGHVGSVLEVEYSPNSKYIASTGEDGTVIVWRTRDGSEVGQPFLGHSTPVIYTLQFMPDSNRLVSATANEAITWDVAERSALPGTGGGSERTVAIVIDRQRHLLMAAGDDGRIRIWDSRTLAKLSTSAPLATEIEDLEIDPKTGLLAVAVSGSDPNTSGIDLLRPGLPPKLSAHLATVDTPISSAFSPSGDQLAVVTNGGDLEVFDLSKHTHPSWHVLVDSSGGSVVDWTADGSHILFAGDTLLASIDDRTHKTVLLHSGTDQSFYSSIYRDPQNGAVITSTFAGRISFDEPNGTATRHPDLIATSALVSSAMSPDGSLISGTGVNGELDLWSASTGQLLASSLPVSEGLTGAIFLDDRRLVVVGEDDTEALVDLDPNALVKTACALVGRNLTQAEFSDYIGNEPYHRTCSQWPAGS